LVLFELDTAGAERFPRNRGREDMREMGKKGKRGKGKGRRAEERPATNPSMLSLFPSCVI